jgi:RimJ/RimL family protein N-acetyltransferase
MIETERLVLRHWRDEDRAPFAAMNADPAVMEYLGPTIDRASSDAAIDRMIALAEAGEPFFRAVERKSDRAFIGFIGVKPINFDAPFGRGHEIGWRLGTEYWGAGYAAEGARAALLHSFETYKLSTIFSFTAVSNSRSEAVMKRIGMSRVEGGDFDHPGLPATYSLRRHILFRTDRQAT